MKNYLVVGGTSGIGRATVIHLVKKSPANVLLCGRNATLGCAIVEEIQPHSPGRVAFQQADITRPDDVDRLFDVVSNRFGRLDGAFNAAGVIGTDTPVHGIPFHESKEEDFDSVFGVNVKGIWRCLRHELRIMHTQAAGSVVNCASVAGLRSADSKSVSYTASKHALVGMTRALAVNYATHGIRVNAVCPGVIETGMLGGMRDELLLELRRRNPSARIGSPEEIAAVVQFLLSDDSAYISGVALVVDAGGLTGAL